MVTQGSVVETLRPTVLDLDEVLAPVTLLDLQRANYPIITVIPRHWYWDYNVSETRGGNNFWTSVFDKYNFFPIAKRVDWSKEVLFVMHVFGTPQDLVFKAVTTTAQEIEDMPECLRYEFHGYPYEHSTRDLFLYPTIGQGEFWDIYDSLSEQRQGRMPLLSNEYRRRYYEQLFLERRVQ